MLITQLGLPHIRGARSFIAAMFIDSFGSGLFVPFSLLYFHIVAGLSLLLVGFVLSVASILSLPITIVTGFLVDRIGTRRVLIISQLLLTAGFLGYIFVHTAPALFALAFIATSGDRMFWVAQPTLIAEIAGSDEQDRWYGLVGSVRMVGLSIGGLLAGFVISLGSRGYQVLAGADALSFLIVVALILPHLGKQTNLNTERQPFSGYRTILKDRPFLGLVICNIAFIFCIFMLTTALPIYAIEALRVPAWIVGFGLALNTILIAGAQTLIVRLMEPYRRTSVLVVAGLVWSGSCVLLALALIIPQPLLFPYLIAVVAIYSCAQLMHGPTANALAAQAGPMTLRGCYVATYQLSWGIGIALTPVLFTSLFASGPALPWVLLAGLTTVAALVIHQIGWRLPAQAVRMYIDHSLTSVEDSDGH